jgi:hypothetical protein
VKRRTNVALIALVVVGLSIPAVEYWRGETLQQLQACYREIPTAGRQCFVSPCGSMIWRRLGLAGISVAQMESNPRARERLLEDTYSLSHGKEVRASVLVIFLSAAGLPWRRTQLGVFDR